MHLLSVSYLQLLLICLVASYQEFHCVKKFLSSMVQMKTLNPPVSMFVDICSDSLEKFDNFIKLVLHLFHATC